MQDCSARTHISLPPHSALSFNLQYRSSFPRPHSRSAYTRPALSPLDFVILHAEAAFFRPLLTNDFEGTMPSLFAAELTSAPLHFPAAAASSAACLSVSLVQSSAASGAYKNASKIRLSRALRSKITSASFAMQLFLPAFHKSRALSDEYQCVLERFIASPVSSLAPSSSAFVK